MKRKIATLVLATIFMAPLYAKELPAIGTVDGRIDHTDSDVNGIFSIWLKIHGVMHEFVLEKAKVIDGKKADLVQGMKVRVKYKNLEQSEMDAFYTAEAEVVSIIKKPGSK